MEVSLERGEKSCVYELAGAFAFGGADVQAELLREDGVEVVDGKVDLTKYQMADLMEE